MGSPACLLSESTEKFVSGCLQRLPSAAKCQVSGGQALDGLTNVPLAVPYQCASLWLAFAAGPGPGKSSLSYHCERSQGSDGPMATVPPR